MEINIIKMELPKLIKHTLDKVFIMDLQNIIEYFIKNFI